MNRYVILIHLYCNECWSVSSEMKKRYETREMWLYRMMLRIPWAEHVINEEVLRSVDIFRTHNEKCGPRKCDIHRTYWRQKRAEGNQLIVKRQTFLRPTMGKKLWRAMILKRYIPWKVALDVKEKVNKSLTMLLESFNFSVCALLLRLIHLTMHQTICY